jgi:hypothetical protein
MKEDANIEQILNSVIYTNEVNVTLTNALVENRTNDFLDFLIVLGEEHYKRRFFGKSDYEKIKEQQFPGYIHILNMDELKARSKEFSVDGTVILKKLYIKLPKEHLYVDANKYQEKYLNSTMNEFMRIVATLNCSSIHLKIVNQNKDQFDLNLNASVIAKGYKIGGGANASTAKDNHTENEWSLEFDDNKEKIDIQIFLHKASFYYLPKYPAWNDLIRNRMRFGAKEAQYVYEYTDTNDIQLDFISKLHLLNIDFKYNKNKYQSLRFEYDIQYHPLPIITIENAPIDINKYDEYEEDYRWCSIQ